MKYCPNPECPGQPRPGIRAEFNDDVRRCSDCGEALVTESELPPWEFARPQDAEGQPEPIVDDLDVQLDRLADLLANRGMAAFFANPLITPERKWFPDRWTPNLASVRRLLLRFAGYAGMANLRVEVGMFAREQEPQWLPPVLAVQGQESGAAALFMGIDDNTAFFAVESSSLTDPVQLLGVLAHEMAHAWRHTMGLPVDDHHLEEQLTDLTTVVLGWGILTSNAAYQYRSSGEQRGVLGVTKWSHKLAGYLPVETMAALLAVHAVAREEELRDIRRHLGATQVDSFDKTANWLARVDLVARLGLSPHAGRPFPEIERARELNVPLSRAGTALHELVILLVNDLGEGGGIAGSMIPFLISPYEERHAALATWGRADPRGGWWRRLFIVGDPEWATNALALELVDGDSITRYAVGHLTDQVCSNKRKLGQALATLFDSGSPHATALLPALPGFVGATSPDTLGISEIEGLFLRAASRFAPDLIAGEVQWLKSFGTQVRARLVRESKPDAPAPDAERPRDPVREWWRLVSDLAQANAEWGMVGLPVLEETSDPPTFPGDE